MMDWLQNFTFLRPWWLLALLPGGGLLWLLLRKKYPMRLYRGLIAPHLLKYLITGETRHGIFHPILIFPLIWLLLVIALSGPSWRMEPSPFAEQQAGLMVLLKVSDSMKAQDLPPSRLERAKYKLHDLFSIRGKEPAGLIAYSGSAHLVMPLTRDTRIIELMAGELDPTVMPVDGDRLNDGLEFAREQFEHSKTTGSVLVITDSIDESQAEKLSEYHKNNGPPVQVLAMAPEQKTARAAVASGARAINASVHTITVDDKDVREIVDRAKRIVTDISANKEGSRQKDEGYLLVPLIVLFIGLWARRGWSLQWQ